MRERSVETNATKVHVSLFKLKPSATDRFGWHLYLDLLQILQSFCTHEIYSYEGY